MAANWWKCQIVDCEKNNFQFHTGDIVFAKNGDRYITLFDGWKEVLISKREFKNIRLLSKLDKTVSSSIEKRYQFRQATEPSTGWDLSIVRG